MNLFTGDITGLLVLSIVGTASVKELSRLLNDRTISGAPIVGDEGQSVGVIPITDILAENFRKDEFGQADFYASPSTDRKTGLEDISPPVESRSAVPEMVRPGIGLSRTSQ